MAYQLRFCSLGSTIRVRLAMMKVRTSTWEDITLELEKLKKRGMLIT